MEVKLEKRYPLDVDAVRAWQVLRDVKTTAGCMPGAEITEQIDATHYKGSVKVKVGPANAAFGGDIEVKALDEATRTLQLLGKGSERGGSTASMDLTATVEAGETPTSSVLVGNAAVIVNGKFAQFGGRMMVQVSDMLLAQFADNFRAAAAALPAPEGAPAAAATAAAAPAAPRKNEINALAILWGLIKGWLAGLFGKRA
ncbi:MAG: SRPBCC family protein [Piscinibacter sp.]